MARDPKKVFSKTYNTKSRREFMDYDYIEQLSEKDKKWLAKFTDEYYTSTYQYSNAWGKRTEVLDLLESELDYLIKSYKCRECKTEFKTLGYCPKCQSFDFEYAKQRKVDNIKYNIERIRKSKRKYIQIYGNLDKKDDLDLRKCRKIDVYYKNEKGKYTKNTKYKYKDTNVHDVSDPEVRKDCNDRSNHAKDDIMNNKLQIEEEDEKYFGQDMLQGEEYFILNEEIRNRGFWDDDLDEISVETLKELLNH